jgi:hypothetical protein
MPQCIPSTINLKTTKTDLMYKCIKTNTQNQKELSGGGRGGLK